MLVLNKPRSRSHISRMDFRLDAVDQGFAELYYSLQTSILRASLIRLIVDFARWSLRCELRNVCVDQEAFEAKASDINIESLYPRDFAISIKRLQEIPI